MEAEERPGRDMEAVDKDMAAEAEEAEVDTEEVEEEA
jgi:hypothetical protein